MNAENKKLIFSLIIIILLVVLVIGFVNLRKSERNDSSNISADSSVSSGESGLSQESIDFAAEKNDAANEMKKTEDMAEKLGFEPKVFQTFSDGLTAFAVKYIDENDISIRAKLEDASAEQVKGIEYSFLKSGMEIGSSVKLKCKKMSEEEFNRHAYRFLPESVGVLDYKGKKIHYISKKILFVNEDTYNELVNAENYEQFDKYELVIDNESNKEIAPIVSCEWYDSGVGYELMGKRIDDMQLMLEYSKELIDYEANSQN